MSWPSSALSPHSPSQLASPFILLNSPSYQNIKFCHQHFLLDPFYRRDRVYKRKFCLSVCGFVRHPSSNIQWFDDLDHANHIFSESSSCWQPVPPCSDPVPPSTNQYRPLLTQYSMIWWFRPCKPNIFWKHITLATSTALFWSSITKYRPVPPYTDPVPPSNNQCRPLPTKYNQVPISTA